MALELRPNSMGDGLQYLTSGEETMSRLFADGTATLATGTLRLAYFTARKSEPITQVRFTATVGAVATPSLIRYGVFTVAANGDITLIASTPNDTALLLTAGVKYPKALSAGFTKVMGVRYAVGALVVTAQTAPGVAGKIGNSIENAEDPKVAAAVSAQTDLLGSYTNAQCATSSNIPYAVLLP